MSDETRRKRLYFVPGFHIDSVGWNTQAHNIETGHALAREQGSAFQLLRAYFDACRKDPAYRFVLEQVAILKPYFDSHPEERKTLTQLIEEGRVELVGGGYNHCQSTLVPFEAQLRNLIYGTRYQRDILGQTPTTAWLLDTYGHDPSTPQILASCGLLHGALARGPYHHRACPTTKQNLPSEFRWMASDGSSILLHFMPCGRDFGYQLLQQAATEEHGHRLIAVAARDLSTVAATDALLVPLIADAARPLPRLGDIVRREMRREEEFRPEIALPREFFWDVDSQVLSSLPFTRELGPIFTGASVTYATLKRSFHDGWTHLLEAESWSTLAALNGLPYPAEILDHVERALLEASDHESLAGSINDQSFIDLLASYRLAHDSTREVLDRALGHLTKEAPSTSPMNDRDPEDQSVAVFNASPRTRTGPTKVVLEEAPSSFEVLNAKGESIPFLLDKKRSELRFVAPQVPSLGFETYTIRPDPIAHPPSIAFRTVERPTTITNEFFAVTLDPSRGGTIVSLRELGRDREWIPQGGAAGNELVFHDEYPRLPGQGDGPRHLCPKGERFSFREASCQLSVHRSDVVQEARIEGDHLGVAFRQTVSLYEGVDRIEFRTEIFSYQQSSRLLRVHFPLDAHGHRPMGDHAIGCRARAFSRDTDTAKDPWTLDTTATSWAGIAHPLILHLGPEETRTLGIGELIYDRESPEPDLDELSTFLARRGVSLTPVEDEARRFGRLAFDSHRPDFRLALGNADTLQSLHKHITSLTKKGLLTPDSMPNTSGSELLWIESPEDVPWLVVWARPDQIDGEIESMVASLREQGTLHAKRIGSSEQPSSGSGDFLALMHRGQPSYHITEKEIALALFRSCPSWPSGRWIDNRPRRHPDGSPFSLMHWTQSYEYAITAGAGHPLDAGIDTKARDYRLPLRAKLLPRSTNPPMSFSAFGLDSPSVELSSLRRGGCFGVDELRGGEEAPATIEIRLVETAGRESSVTLRGLPPHQTASWIDPLGGSLGEAPIEGDTLETNFEPHEFRTLSIRLAADFERHQAPKEEDPILASRYWSLNLGPAPPGFGSSTVLLDPRHQVVRAGTPFQLSILVANHRLGRELVGTLEIAGPRSWGFEPHPRKVVLPPGGFRRNKIKVTIPTDVTTPQGLDAQGLFRVTFKEEGGAIYEDFAQVDLEEHFIEEVLKLELPQRSLFIRPGKHASLGVRLENKTRTAFPVILVLTSPIETWEQCPRGQQTLFLQGREKEEARFDIHMPRTLTRGESFAVIKVLAAGRVFYTPSVRIAPLVKPLIALEDRRDRLNRQEPTFVRGAYVSPTPIDQGTTLGLQVPRGFASRVIDRRIAKGTDGVYRMPFNFEVTPPQRNLGRDIEFSVFCREPRRGSVRASFRPLVPPTLRAANVRASLDVDDLMLAGIAEAEWVMATPGHGKRVAWNDEQGGLRARLQAGWNNRQLLFVVEVKGTIQFNDQEGARILEGDAVRIAIDPSERDPIPGASGDVIDFVAALARGRPRLWCLSLPGKHEAGENENIQVRAERQKGKTRYAISVTCSAVGMRRPVGGRRLGFTFAAYSNAEEGKREVADWTPGLAFGRDASLFGINHLEGAEE